MVIESICIAYIRGFFCPPTSLISPNRVKSDFIDTTFTQLLLVLTLICSVTDLVQVKEFYSHRADKLQERVHNHHTGWITEYYAPGRHRCLRGNLNPSVLLCQELKVQVTLFFFHDPEHQYKASAPGPENDRTMIFYHEARVDGLHKRVETPTEITEHFISRDDFLFYRFIQFGKRTKKFGPAETSNIRPIVVRTRSRCSGHVCRPGI